MYDYFIQCKRTGIASYHVKSTSELYDFIRNIYACDCEKPETFEIYSLQVGADPRRVRWGYDGITLWIYDRYDNVLDHFPASKEESLS